MELGAGAGSRNRSRLDQLYNTVCPEALLWYLRKARLYWALRPAISSLRKGPWISPMLTRELQIAGIEFIVRDFLTVEIATVLDVWSVRVPLVRGTIKRRQFCLCTFLSFVYILNRTKNPRLIAFKTS